MPLCAHCGLKLLIFIVCSTAVGVGLFLSLSIPYNIAVFYSYTVQIEFNEQSFTGSVNEFSVENITTLRLGNWGPSYADSLNADREMPGKFFGYTVDIANLKDNSTHNIVTQLETLTLLFNTFLLISILFTYFHIFPEWWKKVLVVEIAVVILAIAAVASNYGFYIAIQNEMQKFGETIVTTKGPAFLSIGAIVLCVLVVAILNRFLARKIAKPVESKSAESKPAESKPAKSTADDAVTASKPAAVEQTQKKDPPPPPSNTVLRMTGNVPGSASNDLERALGTAAIYKQLEKSLSPSTGPTVLRLTGNSSTAFEQALGYHLQGILAPGTAPAAPNLAGSRARTAPPAFQRRQGLPPFAVIPAAAHGRRPKKPSKPSAANTMVTTQEQKERKVTFPEPNIEPNIWRSGGEHASSSAPPPVVIIPPQPMPTENIIRRTPSPVGKGKNVDPRNYGATNTDENNPDVWGLVQGGTRQSGL